MQPGQGVGQPQGGGQQFAGGPMQPGQGVGQPQGGGQQFAGQGAGQPGAATLRTPPGAPPTQRTPAAGPPADPTGTPSRASVRFAPLQPNAAPPRNFFM